MDFKNTSFLKNSLFITLLGLSFGIFYSNAQAKPILSFPQNEQLDSANIHTVIDSSKSQYDSVSNAEINAVVDSSMSTIDANSDNNNASDTTANTATSNQDTTIASSDSIPNLKIIDGTIMDQEANAPMPGVSVKLLKTGTTAVSDENGQFEMDAPHEADTLVADVFGFKKVSVLILPDSNQSVAVPLLAVVTPKEEVVITGKKQKYRNKNNPAVELIRKVIAHRPENRINNQEYVQYDFYKKMQFALLADTNKKYSAGKLFKQFQFVFDNVDTSKIAGKAITPLIMEEHLEKRYYQKLPERDKTITVAEKKIKFDPHYVDNEGMSSVMNHIFQNVDIYDNNIKVLTNNFLSPIANGGPTFYRYYLRDTTIIDNIKVVHLYFEPRNENDFLFKGNLYITLDGHYAVQNADLSVGGGINLDWVKALKMNLDFGRDTNGKYYLKRNNMQVQFAVPTMKKGAYGELTSVVSNYDNYTPIPDSIFKGPSKVILNTADSFNDNQWENLRPEQLSSTETKAYENMDKLNGMKSFKRLMDWGSFFVAGYKKAGPFEVGPSNTFYSFNPVEGLRVRLGGRSTTDLSKRFYTETYGAYGFKDKKFKYFLSGTYSFNNKSIYKYPQNYLRVSYQNDTKIPGQDLQFVQESSFLLSFKRGKNDRWLYNKNFKVDYVYEFGNHMRINAGYNWWRQNAAGSLYFLNEGTSDTVKNLTTSAFSIQFRYAPNEEFTQGKLYRVPLYNQYPIFTVKATTGLKDFVGGQYNFINLYGSIYKRVYLSQLGLADVQLEGGNIFGKVPFPLLTIHRANQSYAYQVYSYNLMNFMEFVSDHYAALTIDYHMYGFIFNKIPLFKKLHFREVASFRALYGGVRNENNPDKLGANDPRLMSFPKDDRGNIITYSLDKTPYVEGSVGVENILNLFRVDLVRRFTYLDHPYVAKWGVRFFAKFDF